MPIGLETLGIPPATARIVAFFARNPTARPTVRELQRTLGVSSASAQRDLDRLSRAGALRAVEDGRLRRYAPVMDSPLWSAVRILIATEQAASVSRIRERAARYGVDLTQLQSTLRLTVEERILRLEADAAFLKEARTGRRK
jgi:predicted DNA-binding transcriptional regulator YafY